MTENDTALCPATAVGSVTQACSSVPPTKRASNGFRWPWPLLRRQFRGIAAISVQSDTRKFFVAHVSLAQCALVACATVALSGCGSSSVELVSAPTASRCGLATTVPAVAFPPSGGSGMVGVTANRDCTWNVNSDAAWLIPDQASGQGEAVITFTVAANTAITSRRGTLVFDGVRVDIAQDGVPCQFAVEKARVEFGADGGVARITVTTLPGCAWTAKTSESWITLTQTADQVELSVSANTGPQRVGTVTIAGNVVEVVQQEPVSVPSPSPAPAPIPSPTPSPSPVPTPTPTPQPAPLPPTGETVEVQGRVEVVTGVCPTIIFTVAGRTIITTPSTEYRRGNCGHVQPGAEVLVVGQATGAIVATRIDILQRATD